MKSSVKALGWIVLSCLGAWAYAVLAIRRGENISSAYILLAAVCTYAIGYRFYSKWIAASVLALNDRRATPAESHEDGKDYVKTSKWIVFGHHFAAISGPGPLVGPVLAAQFGYLPGTLWILIGVALGGAVQDFVILFCSIRRRGKSLGQMVKEEINSFAGIIGLTAILAIIVILLAVLALVVVTALAESPWGVFTVGATIPIAMFMGGYLRYWRAGKVLEVTAIGVVLLLLSVWGGQFIHADATLAKHFTFSKTQLAWAILVYGFAASVLPVWLLLAPRDYLSTFMKLGTILALALGVFLVLPELKMPALSKFIDGSGPVVPGKLFPFCFITIACGAISGFHTLISSGTTPKIITREGYARPIGYGAMCLESLVAIMAIIAACTLEPGVYFSMNISLPAPDHVAKATATVAKVTSLGFPVTGEQMSALATQVGEPTLFGKTGGAATLAVGMASIFSQVTRGRWLDIWYHFAIMFEALFILTTLDAGTRVGRYLLQDALGHIWKPLGNMRNHGANILASALMVAGWGFFLIQGVRDPDGGVRALWPLFGIANQLLASIALCLATTVILKMHLQPPGEGVAIGVPPARRHPALALVVLVPLAWLLAVTLTAGVQKIWHPDPRIGFIAAVKGLEEKRPALEKALKAAQEGSDITVAAAEKALRANAVLRFNNQVDIVVTGTFLVMVVLIVLLSVREWLLLLARRLPAKLSEEAPVWLPDYALAENNKFGWLSLFTLFFALARELSGEAAVDRAERAVIAAQSETAPATNAVPCTCAPGTRQLVYIAETERRYQGVTRCC